MNIKIFTITVDCFVTWTTEIRIFRRSITQKKEQEWKQHDCQ